VLTKDLASAQAREAATDHEHRIEPIDHRGENTGEVPLATRWLAWRPNQYPRISD
jgi:hypothetical protein